jgi:hypothetical protein
MLKILIVDKKVGAATIVRCPHRITNRNVDVVNVQIISYLITYLPKDFPCTKN